MSDVSVSTELFGYLKMMAILAGVIIFAFVALRVWLPKLTGIHGMASGPMHVAYRMALEPRKTLYIVRAGSNYLMLASSDAGVQYLVSLDEAGVEAGLRNSSVKPEAGFDFARLVRPRTRRQDSESAK